MTKLSFGTCEGKGKTKAVRNSGYLCVLSIIMVILITFGGAAFYLRNYYNGIADFYNFHKGDEISIRHIEGNDFSSLLCKKYHVEPWTKADVYLLHSKAKVNKHHKKIIRKQLVHGRFSIFNIYKYDAFYLLKHSEILVNACSTASPYSDMDVEVDVLIFKGKESWNKWKGNQGCRKSAIMTLSLTGKDLCSEGKRTMKYKVHHTDNYYVAVARRYKRDLHKVASMNVDLLVERTTYKLEKVKEFCLNTTSCMLNLTYSSEEDIVIKIKDDEFSNDAFFTTRCRLRVMFWMGIFAILPVVMILFIVSCCCFCAACKRKQTLCQKPQPYNYNDKAILVINEQLPEKKLPLPEDQLPSYEAATGTKLQVV